MNSSAQNKIENYAKYLGIRAVRRGFSKDDILNQFPGKSEQDSYDFVEQQFNEMWPGFRFCAKDADYLFFDVVSQ